MGRARLGGLLASSRPVLRRYSDGRFAARERIAAESGRGGSCPAGFLTFAGQVIGRAIAMIGSSSTARTRLASVRSRSRSGMASAAVRRAKVASIGASRGSDRHTASSILRTTRCSPQLPGRLEDRVAIVTGAGRGIGRRSLGCSRAGHRRGLRRAHRMGAGRVAAAVPAAGRSAPEIQADPGAPPLTAARGAGRSGGTPAPAVQPAWAQLLPARQPLALGQPGVSR